MKKRLEERNKNFKSNSRSNGIVDSKFHIQSQILRKEKKDSLLNNKRIRNHQNLEKNIVEIEYSSNEIFPAIKFIEVSFLACKCLHT